MAKSKQLRAKRERVIEAVRHGLEGDAALEFIHQNGYALTQSGLARHLRTMGGRGRVQELIAVGKSNVEILQECFPEDDLSELRATPPSQQELFDEDEVVNSMTPFPGTNAPLYATAKLTIRVPAELYEAVRIASRAEGKTQNQLIVDILTWALSRMPESMPESMGQ
ncbi:MAG TPA: hypothetical protein ENN80_06510 [Candidatus Hydrogenedentes bacterium]|nr:hypothetical protein [Candidatus Hydrogenedentota bacterium]